MCSGAIRAPTPVDQAQLYTGSIAVIPPTLVDQEKHLLYTGSGAVLIPTLVYMAKPRLCAGSGAFSPPTLVHKAHLYKAGAQSLSRQK
jgi:hypothetical protein